MKDKRILIRPIIVLVLLIVLSYGVFINLSNTRENIPEEENEASIAFDKDATTPDDSLIIIDGVMIFNKDNYIKNIVELMYNFDSYHGMNVKLEGFVAKPEEIGDYSFLVARYVMTCCEEDLEVIMLDCFYDEEIPAENTWVSIEGSLQAMDYYDENLGRETQKPLIIVSAVEVIPEPENHYLDLEP